MTYVYVGSEEEANSIRDLLGGSRLWSRRFPIWKIVGGRVLNDYSRRVGEMEDFPIILAEDFIRDPMLYQAGPTPYCPYPTSKTETPKIKRVKTKTTQQEKTMLYLVAAYKKATVREQENGQGDTLVGELKAVCAVSEAGAIAQYTQKELKETDLTGVEVQAKVFQ